MHRVCNLLRQVYCRPLCQPQTPSFASFYYSALLKQNVGVSSLPQIAGTVPQVAGKTEIKVIFTKDGKTHQAYGKEGDTLLDLVINNELDFDGFGACEGTLACSTCHVILSQEEYAGVPNKPCDEELDMLDLAYDLTDTSRLGCQIQVTKGMSGMIVKIPETRHDARS